MDQDYRNRLNELYQTEQIEGDVNKFIENMNQNLEENMEGLSQVMQTFWENLTTYFHSEAQGLKSTIQGDFEELYRMEVEKDNIRSKMQVLDNVLQQQIDELFLP